MKIVAYTAMVMDAEGMIVDEYSSTMKTPVKQAFNEMYTRYKFGGVTGQHERATLSLQHGEPTAREDGWTIRITTTTSYL